MAAISKSRVIVEPPLYSRLDSPVLSRQTDIESIVIERLRQSARVFDQVSYERVGLGEKSRGELAGEMLDILSHLNDAIQDALMPDKLDEFVAAELVQISETVNEFLNDPGLSNEIRVAFLKETIKISVFLNNYIQKPSVCHEQKVKIIASMLAAAEALNQFNDDFLTDLQEKVSSQAAQEMESIPSSFLRHELRAPLQNLIGVLSCMEGVASDAQYNKILEDGYKHLASLSDLLGAEGLKLQTNPRTFRLSRLIEYVHNQTKNYDNGRVKIQFNIPADLVVYADFQKLSIALINLITNAIKYSPDGEMVEVLIENSGSDFRFAITDRGPGMTEDVIQNQLFRIFSPGSSSHRKIKSSGLGLYISQMLVKAMGGKIQVKSELGQGSTFFFGIPIEPGKEEEIDRSPIPFRSDTPMQRARTPLKVSPTPGPRVRLRNENLRILWADDDRTSWKVYPMILKLAGLKTACTLVKDGASAVDAFKSGNYDLVILDKNMPVMGGCEAAIAIRAHNLAVPIILATGDDSNPEFNIDGRKAILTKPVKNDTLIPQINEWFS
ncbi:MAG: response regulator [Parachlamydiales bacterium]|nr:response regulator [Parachlamydiales bacterium]